MEDCIYLIFTVCNTDTKISLSLINIKLYSRLNIRQDIIACIKNLDGFSILKNKKWYRYVNSMLLGKLGSIILIVAYEKYYPLNAQYCFVGACREGHLDIVKIMIQRGISNWDLGMKKASIGNHKHIMDFLKNTKTNWIWNKRCILAGIAKNNNPSLDPTLNIKQESWIFLIYTIKGGHLDILKSICNDNYIEIILPEICRAGHEHIYDYIVSKFNVRNMMTQYLYMSSNINIIKKILGTNRLSILVSCAYGDIQLVRAAVEHGETDYEEGLLLACFRGYFEIAKLLISLGTKINPKCLAISCKKGYVDIVKLLLGSCQSSNIPTLLDISKTHERHYIHKLLKSYQ